MIESINWVLYALTLEKTAKLGTSFVSLRGPPTVSREARVNCGPPRLALPSCGGNRTTP